jgi:hypothetical protein
VSTITDSILTSTKKVLGLAEDYTDFDQDVITFINAAFFTLNQLGVGPDVGFQIEDDAAVWDDFSAGDIQRNNGVKTYVYLRVRLLFDPPTTSYLIDSLDKQRLELESRLSYDRENDILADVPVDYGRPNRSVEFCEVFE